ncbi:MAG TPA: glycoside hydrolase family 3 N-terminal domain-containing protein [Pyrinomonadaceae bacterium]|jgi:beta-N-acetylhexosaminidase|nr:glycoside hydrolase family 3 N-terminal domain-containing protein [Pyrinomonadaceae bacterium]
MKEKLRTSIQLKVILALLLTLAVTPLRQFETPAQPRAKSPSVRAYSAKPTKAALQWADKELRRMSLDEKIGQLVSVGINATFLNQDSEAFKELRHQVEDNHVGGIILFRGSVYESVILVNRMQARARYPLLISSDLEAGAGMRFDDTINLPWNMAVGATDNPDYARRQGALTARESRALGVQQIYAPVADVNNNAANPVINVRSYGEDPATVGRFVAAFVEGAQSNGVIATAKHFPGHGDTATDSHRGLPEINVSRDRLNAVELVPFRAAINAGVGSVMTGHIGMPQIDPTAVFPLPRDVKLKPIETDEGGEVVVEKGSMPTTLSPVMNGMLRRELGFDGLIVTDAMSMSGLTLYFTQEEASVRALDAGADLLLKPADPDAAIRGVKEAVLKGRLTEQRIDASARRVLAAKFDLGLVKQRITPLEAIDMNVAGQDAVKLANEIAEHAITLVRNDDKLVPQRSLKPDARIFNLAMTNGDDRLWIANAFAQSIGRQFPTLPGADGTLRRKVETVVLDDRSTDAEVQKALERAKGADLIVASLYGRVRSGQARSVGLPDAGAKALSRLMASKAPFVAISFGNPYLLQSFPELRTYVVAYGDMPSLQQAAARALLGEIDVTGKLPISLPGLYPRGTGIQLKR